MKMYRAPTFTLDDIAVIETMTRTVWMLTAWMKMQQRIDKAEASSAYAFAFDALTSFDEVGRGILETLAVWKFQAGVARTDEVQVVMTDKIYENLRAIISFDFATNEWFFKKSPNVSKAILENQSKILETIDNAPMIDVDEVYAKEKHKISGKMNTMLN